MLTGSSAQRTSSDVTWEMCQLWWIMNFLFHRLNSGFIFSFTFRATEEITHGTCLCFRKKITWWLLRWINEDNIRLFHKIKCKPVCILVSPQIHQIHMSSSILLCYALIWQRIGDTCKWKTLLKFKREPATREEEHLKKSLKSEKLVLYTTNIFNHILCISYHFFSCLCFVLLPWGSDTPF